MNIFLIDFILTSIIGISLTAAQEIRRSSLSRIQKAFVAATLGPNRGGWFRSQEIE
jgi:hypothetical protein